MVGLLNSLFAFLHAGVVDFPKIWHAAFWVAGVVKIGAVTDSVATAVGLGWIVPRTLRSARELEYTNRRLADEIEERKRVEKELVRAQTDLERRVRERTAEVEKANDRFRLAVESAPNAMIMVDSKGLIVLVNAQTEKMFGYSRDELLGELVDRLIPERFRARHLQDRVDFQGHPQTRPMGAGRDLFGLRKDGTEFPVEIGLNPITIGEEIHVLSAVVDITERKKADELIRAALGEKEILLREIHHRVKNNLQVIASLLRMQSDYTSDEAVIEMFRESQNRVHSMAMIHERLYQSKDLSRIDLHEYAKSLCNDLFRSFGAHSVMLHVDVDKIEVGIDTANACGLILNELVTNALRHAFPGGRQGSIYVTIDEDQFTDGSDKETRGLTLVVSDDGVGLPPGVDVRHADTLGLQLVAAITHQMEGSIELERDPGTRFKIAFKELRYGERMTA